jgi:hypothetical protein
MYLVREVLILVVLANLRISVSALTLRGGKSPGGGSRHRGRPPAADNR